jgi:hypothetical protein
MNIRGLNTNNEGYMGRTIILTGWSDLYGLNKLIPGPSYKHSFYPHRAKTNDIYADLCNKSISNALIYSGLIINDALYSIGASNTDATK